jgi:ATP-dependent Clp protease adapter protein ClpS
MSQNHANHPVDPSPNPRRRARGRGAIPQVKLMLQADRIVDLMSVVRTIMELTRFCTAEATNKMWQAYHFGQAFLFVTYRERAELFVELFADRGLRVTIEPA